MTVRRRRAPRGAALTAITVATLGLLAAAVGAPSAQAAAEARTSDSRAQTQAGTDESSPTDTSPTDTAAGTDLSGSDEEWTTPDLVAQAALVQVQTMADVYVAVHHFKVAQYSYTVTDPQAVATGTFLDSHGLAVTGGAALHDDATQEERFATWGINQAFVDAGFMSEMPDDPFERTTITAQNKGPLADTPPTDPAINDRLQDCYKGENSYHCAVFVVMRQRVVSSVQDKDSRAMSAMPQSGGRTAMLSTQPQGITPLTLQLADPQPGEKYWVLATQGVNKEPLIATGTLTDSADEPLEQSDLTTWAQQFGSAAEGAAVISRNGDLIAVLTTATTGDTSDDDSGSAGTDTDGALHAVPAAEISTELRDLGLTHNSSAVDAQFQDGLELFEASQFAAAVPKLKAAAEASGGQLVVRDLLTQAQEQSGTAQDLSDEADALSDTQQDQGGWSSAAVVTFTALVVLVLLGAGIALAMTRPGRRAPHGSGASSALGTAQPEPAQPEPAQIGHRDPAEHGSLPIDRPTTDAQTEHPVPPDPEPRAFSPAGSGNTGSGSTGSSSTGSGWSGGLPARTSGSGPAGVAPVAEQVDPADDGSREGRLTTIFATGTVDPRPTDPGQAPTLQRGAQGSGTGTGRPSQADPVAPARSSGRYCSHCGSRLSPGDRFCFSCGTPAGPSAGED